MALEGQGGRRVQRHRQRPAQQRREQHQEEQRYQAVPGQRQADLAPDGVSRGDGPPAA